MTNYYISDNHFQHARIMEFCPLSRPFKMCDEMDEFMIESWNRSVPENGIVYHLGDFSFGRETSFEKAQEIFSRLNGRKHLILGNHEEYGKKLPWDSIMQYREIRESGDIKVVLFHYPLEDWNRRFHGSYHFHGHVHSTKEKPYRYVKNRLDVGVDFIGFEPKTFEELKVICDSRTD